METLRSKRLRASNPAMLNDPFELSPNFNLSNYNRDFVKSLALKDHIIQRGWELQDLNIYPNYETYKKYWIQDIDKKVEEMMPEVAKNIQEQKKSFLTNFATKWRILCFSRVIDSILLWSHYADSHHGIALEFDTNDSYISQLGNDCCLEVNYSISKAYFEPWHDEEDFYREVRKATMWKSKDWEYEQEVRILLSIDELNNDFLPFVKRPVRGVYLGIHSDEETIVKIGEILSD